MKKIIALVVVAAIAIGGFFAFNKTAELGSLKVDELITENLNKPYDIKAVSSHPLLDKATITLTNYNNNELKSIFELDSIASIPTPFTTKIPFKSIITKGKQTHNGDSFGLAHIVTKIDFSSPDISLPKVLQKSLKEDSLVINDYLGINGDIREIATLKETNFIFEDADTSVLTKGIDLVWNGNIQTFLDNKFSGDFDAKFKEINVTNSGDVVNISPVHMTGNITGDVTTVATDSFNIKGSNGNEASIGKINMVAKTKYSEKIKDDLGDINLKIENIKIKPSTTEDSMVFDSINIDAFAKESSKVTIDLGSDITAIVSSTQAISKEIPIKIKNLNFGYKLTQAPNSVVAMLKSIQQRNNIEDLSEKEIDGLIAEVKDSKLGLSFNTNLKADEGNFDFDFSSKLNGALSALSVEEVKERFQRPGPELMNYINVKIKASLDKSLAEASGLNLYVQMFGSEYISETDTKINVDIKIKDGIMTVNGVEKPLF